MFNIIAAHQPNFLPNLGFFHKMQQADIFVLVTNLQFEKQEGWQQRNRIPSKNGDVWITIPVLGSQNQKLKHVKINNQINWCKKHKKTFRFNYSKSEESDLFFEIEEICDSKPERLVDLNIQFIKLIRKLLNIKTKLIVDEDIQGNKHELLINLCKKYNALTYLSGDGARNYINDKYLLELRKNNIKNCFIKNPLKDYPYSVLHYILKEGRGEVIQKLKQENLVIS